MRGTRWIATALAAAALAAGGCGGDDEETDTGTAGGGETTTTEQAAPPAEAAADGKQLFSNTCGGCHVLSDAGTSGQTGPNLDEMKPDADRVKEAIAEGPGIMPENLYEGAEADAVAQYVADSAGK